MGIIVAGAAERDELPGPYQQQVARHMRALGAADAKEREAAAESLGYLRAWGAADALVGALKDETPAVRREAAMSLGFCGGRKHVAVLLGALEDADWTVRQAAWVALTNLTGMEFPFDALSPVQTRRTAAIAKWRDWWAGVPADRPAKETIDMLGSGGSGNLAAGCAVVTSSFYKGPAGALTDGDTQTFWQTKNVPFPQHFTIDLGRPTAFTRVMIRQYGPGFCMTRYVLGVSEDGRTFRELHRGEAAEPTLSIVVARTMARYLRITSEASQNPTYPTTIREVEVYANPADTGENGFWKTERALRALGALGGEGSAQHITKAIQRHSTRTPVDPSEKAMVQAGLRALGRLGEAASLPLLVEFLNHPHWARYAAEAMGDLGNDDAVEPLVAAFTRYGRNLAGAVPKDVPIDDRPGLEPADRMYEAPHAIAFALSRLPLKEPAAQEAVRRMMPLLLANLPGDFDGALLYEPEASRQLAAHLLARTGQLDAARRAAFLALGCRVESDANDSPDYRGAAARKVGTTVHAASWLPAIAVREDVPQLITLLEHADGWARINAVKALMFMDERTAVEPLARILADSKREADWGYFGGFVFDKPAQGHDEYEDPSPRWREAYVRALGRLGRGGAGEQVPLLEKLVEDEANALEVRHAATVALDEIGTPEALAILARIERSSPFHSIRLTAREALWKRDRLTMAMEDAPALPAVPTSTEKDLRGIIFIKGDRVMPNAFQIDPWRQTYSTTDSGPTYRLGRNLFVLRPPTPGGSVTPLTSFTDGFVADCEVSWDGRRILFARRGGSADPWWHLWEMNADGSGLRQLTRGPYHDVQPAYLPDGRIVFSSSRIGYRDEYHGYPATGLTVMNPDGSNIRCIGFNLGRDNEPTILPDGRIAFSRLELFYSRLKTELTLQAVFPDGTRNVVLYGPERRDYWREVTRRSGEDWWGEVPPRHRVLRLTQPQAIDADRIICATTAGLTIIGPQRYSEQVVGHDPAMAVTTPFPLPDGRILCAATMKQRTTDAKGRPVYAPENDLGLHWIDPASGKLTLLYNDPETADFEPRPLMARPVPPVLAESPQARSNAFSAKLVCASVQITQEPLVRERGRLVRVVEGMPILGRHATHNSTGIEAWKNHTGTLARILGTVPLAADGSFHLEIPADRLIHLQVLDSDRRVMGNELIWSYARPGETRSCIGCHEQPEMTPPPGLLRPAAAMLSPVPCLPTGGEFTYRAKFWNKGILSEEGEERTRTVRAVNLVGRQ